MKFYIDTAIKILFLLSTLPFLVSEKLYEKFEFRLTGSVVDSLYTAPHALGTLDNDDIDEASGLVASKLHPSLLYTHNDSGGEPEVYMIDTLGKYQGKIVLEGSHNRDWEDIAIGPGRKAEISYIYIGDIGDNDAKRDKVHVYRFPEPKALESEIKVKAEKITQLIPMVRGMLKRSWLIPGAVISWYFPKGTPAIRSIVRQQNNWRQEK